MYYHSHIIINIMNNSLRYMKPLSYGKFHDTLLNSSRRIAVSFLTIQSKPE